MNIPLRGSQGPLHLLIDSTWIKVEGEGEWNARKHGCPKRRVWRKVHLGIGEETLGVRAVDVTGSEVGDSPMLPELLAQIPADQDIASVTTDGAYDTCKCHDAIAERGAAAVIPPARTPGRGRPALQVRSRATRLCGRRNTSVARSGGDGAGTTAEAVQTRKCTV